MFSLLNKTSVITGASKGIGKNIAELFAKQGSDVHILDMDQEAGEETLKKIRNNGGEAWFHKVDVSRQEEVVDTFDINF